MAQQRHNTHELLNHQWKTGANSSQVEHLTLCLGPQGRRLLGYLHQNQATLWTMLQY